MQGLKQGTGVGGGLEERAVTGGAGVGHSPGCYVLGIT